MEGAGVHALQKALYHHLGAQIESLDLGCKLGFKYCSTATTM